MRANIVGLKNAPIWEEDFAFHIVQNMARNKKITWKTYFSKKITKHLMTEMTILKDS